MMPSSILLPYALCAKVIPKDRAKSATILATVVFPFVPVTAMILSGLSIRIRKSGHSFFASCPGKCVPFKRKVLIKVLVALTNRIVVRNRIERRDFTKKLSNKIKKAVDSQAKACYNRLMCRKACFIVPINPRIMDYKIFRQGNYIT